MKVWYWIFYFNFDIDFVMIDIELALDASNSQIAAYRISKVLFCSSHLLCTSPLVKLLALARLKMLVFIFTFMIMARFFTLFPCIYNFLISVIYIKVFLISYICNLYNDCMEWYGQVSSYFSLPETNIILL